ncbi:MAG: hypothetical protein ABIP93_00800 [Gemmatimonadaceae bacterium]
MERAIEVFAAIQLTVIGVSHIFHHRAWAEFFIWLRGKGLPGVFANGFTNLAMGSMIVGFHRVWSGVPLVLTVFGVLNVVKAAHSFLLPERSLRLMSRVSLERSWEFAAAGVVALVLAAVTAYGVVSGT